MRSARVGVWSGVTPSAATLSARASVDISAGQPADMGVSRSTVVETEFERGKRLYPEYRLADCSTFAAGQNFALLSGGQSSVHLGQELSLSRGIHGGFGGRVTRLLVEPLSGTLWIGVGSNADREPIEWVCFAGSHHATMMKGEAP